MSTTAKSDEKPEAPPKVSDQVDAPAPATAGGSASPRTAHRVKVEPKKVVKRSPVLNAPKVCPPGYRMDASGKCRKVL